MLAPAAFVILLPTFGGLTVTVDATQGIAACHRAYRVLTSQMRAASLAFTTVQACPPDPEAPAPSEPAVLPPSDAP